MVRRRWLVQGGGHWRSLGGEERDTPLVMVVVSSLALVSSLFHSCEWVCKFTGSMASAANVTLVPGGDTRVYTQGITWFNIVSKSVSDSKELKFRTEGPSPKRPVLKRSRGTR